MAGTSERRTSVIARRWRHRPRLRLARCPRPGSSVTIVDPGAARPGAAGGRCGDARAGRRGVLGGGARCSGSTSRRPSAGPPLRAELETQPGSRFPTGAAARCTSRSTATRRAELQAPLSRSRTGSRTRSSGCRAAPPVGSSRLSRRSSPAPSMSPTRRRSTRGRLLDALAVRLRRRRSRARRGSGQVGRGGRRRGRRRHPRGRPADRGRRGRDRRRRLVGGATDSACRSGRSRARSCGCGPGTASSRPSGSSSASASTSCRGRRRAGGRRHSRRARLRPRVTRRRRSRAAARGLPRAAGDRRARAGRGRCRACGRGPPTTRRSRSGAERPVRPARRRRPLPQRNPPGSDQRRGESRRC